MTLNSRPDMEDAHTEILSLKEDKLAAFFGVYDGHGGTVMYSMGHQVPIRMNFVIGWGKKG